MGGTSTDVSLCQAGEPTIGRETTIGQFRIKIPSIDVHTVGAGGGSIAHVPELTGALRVGPESAGAEPGPAAYGRGGTAPTVTDANVVVGHLPPRLIGGEMELDVDAARTAVQTIADAMGLSLDAAAEGILKIVNENMAGALRVISVQRGHDPREFALVAFGGAGPLHANAVAELMGSFPVIVPPSPGLLCALGDLVADFRNEFARTLIRLTSEATADEISAILDELEGRAREWMDAQGIEAGRQTSPSTPTCATTARATRSPCRWATISDAQFNALHEQLYGFRMPDTPSEIVNLRAVGTGVRPKPELPEGELHGPDPGGGPDLRPFAAAAGQPHQRTRGDHRVRLDDGCARGLRGRGGPLLQHPDPTGGAVMSAPAHPRIAQIPDIEIDPITLDIIENALRHARFEMDAVLFRSAMSPVIREQHDEFPMLTDPQGRMVVGQFGAYISQMMAEWDRGIYPGDVILTSDPYKCSASISHTNDWLVLVPIFFEDEIVGWSSQFGHQMDAGGRLPGSLPTGATTVFEEGIIIPPLKIVERGEVQEDVLRLILNNVRLPEMNRADLFAIVAGCRAGEKRVIGLCERFGKDVYLAALQALLDRTHEAMRKLILLAIPEEPQSFEDWIDDDGLGNGPYKMKLTIWREGEQAWFDWSGTDPQALGPINFYLSEGMFKMFIGVYLIMVNDPQILFNDGFYPLLHVVMPEGCAAQPALPGRARLPHARAHAAVRRARRRADQAGAGAQHRRRLRHLAVHALQRLEGERRVLLRDGDPLRRHPRAADRRRHGRPLVVAAVREHPDRVPRGLLPPADRRLHDGHGLRRRRTAPRRQRRREALRVPRAGPGLDPRRPLADAPVGRARRRARRALEQAPAAGRRQRAGAARPSATRSRSRPATCSSTARRAAAAGRTGSTARPSAVARDVAFGLVSREKALAGYGVVLGDDGTVDADATEAERERQRAERGDAKAFDFGPELADVAGELRGRDRARAADAGEAAAVVAARGARATRGRGCGRRWSERLRAGRGGRRAAGGDRRRPRARLHRPGLPARRRDGRRRRGHAHAARRGARRAASR